METTTLTTLIREQNLRWEAADTELSALSDAAQRARLGAEPPPRFPTLTERTALVRERIDPGPTPLRPPLGPPFRPPVRPPVHPPPAAPPPPVLPTAVDWRNHNGTNFVTPVTDQGQCGSCVAFGAVAAFEAAIQIADGNHQPPINLSEADLWFCFGPQHGAGACPSGGWWPDQALPGLVPGIVTDACFAYTDADQVCNRCADAATRLRQIKSWHSVTAVADMKSALANVGPVVTCFQVFEDFYNYSGGVYAPVTSPDNPDKGGHCVAVVGFDDAAGCWICKNSWGSGFGENGFFRIAYGVCGIDAEMWVIDGIVPVPEFGNIAADPMWTGDFSGAGHTEVLFFSPGDQNWWLGGYAVDRMEWSFAANTHGFGNTADDPTWIADFTGSGRSEVLFFSPGDQNWWLGTFSGAQLSWALAGNTHGFGNTAHDPTWIGDFTGSGRSEVLFFSPGDQNWWLGTFAGNQLSWGLAGNTHGFGNTSGDPTWIGDFTGSGRTEVLFFSPGDQNWWLGTFSGAQLSWALAGNTHGFGNTAHDPTWIGDFTGSGRAEVLFFSPGDQNWWLGTFTGNQLSWRLAANTRGFGNTSGDPTWIGDFTGSGRSEVLFFSPGDQNWWLGTFSGAQLSWALAGNTRGFGNTAHDPTWAANFTGTGRTDMLFYSPGDGHWWLGVFSGNQLGWSFAGSTGT